MFSKVFNSLRPAKLRDRALRGRSTGPLLWNDLDAFPFRGFKDVSLRRFVQVSAWRNSYALAHRLTGFRNGYRHIGSLNDQPGYLHQLAFVLTVVQAIGPSVARKIDPDGESIALEECAHLGVVRFTAYRYSLPHLVLPAIFCVLGEGMVRHDRKGEKKRESGRTHADEATAAAR